jgi:hypothetical protein
MGVCAEYLFCGKKRNGVLNSAQAHVKTKCLLWRCRSSGSEVTSRDISVAAGDAVITLTGFVHN